MRCAPELSAKRAWEIESNPFYACSKYLNGLALSGRKAGPALPYLDDSRWQNKCLLWEDERNDINGMVAAGSKSLRLGRLGTEKEHVRGILPR